MVFIALLFMVPFLWYTHLFTEANSSLILSSALLSFCLWFWKVCQHFLPCLPFFHWILIALQSESSPNVFSETTRYVELLHFQRYSQKHATFWIPSLLLQFCLSIKTQLRLTFSFPIVSETFLSRERVQFSVFKIQTHSQTCILYFSPHPAA